MASIIGIDIGTTLIKCSTILSDGRIIDLQRFTPAINFSPQSIDEITFSPYRIWETVQELLREIIHVNSLKNVIISVVSQAPSVCIWDRNGNEIGVSYLSFYGNPKENNYEQRQFKAKCRFDLAERLFPVKKGGFISCITGYIVYQLTGELTIDAITAWELGIESEWDRMIMNKGFFRLAKVYSPIEKFPLLSKNILGVNGNVLVGTSDSAVLPLSTFPFFHDYYVYLGTWGSLLGSKLKNYSNYKMRYHVGQLHNWIISIPDFINKCKNNSDTLEEIFIETYFKTEENCSIAICGGLTKVYTQQIDKLAKKYWNNRQYTVSPIENNAIGACKLGEVAVNEVYI